MVLICDACHLETKKLKRVIISQSPFDSGNEASYYRPIHSSKESHLCPVCTQEKDMQVSYRYIREEYDKKQRGETSKLDNIDKVRIARGKLAEIVDNMNREEFHHKILTQELRNEIQILYNEFNLVFI